jgi:outer membrane protein TolC
MMKKIFCFVSIALVLLNLSATSQDVLKFSLEEALVFALENNYDIKVAENNIEIARKMVKESLAIGLPQINASISNTNYINVPTTLLPDFITPAIFAVNEYNFGLTPEVPQGETQFFPAKFGTEYNANVDISASQLIFSGQYIIGIRTAGTFLEQSKMKFFKDELEVKNAVSRAYYYVLVTSENYAILEENLESLSKMAYETRETFNLGFIEETDADQLDIMVSNLNTTLINLKNQINIAYAQLKYTLGLKQNDSILLTDDLDELIDDTDYIAVTTRNFNYEDNIDYKIMNKQKEIALSKMQLEKSAYLPTLSAFFSAQTNAMRSEYNFFDSDKPWYPTTVWGVEMNIPIFSSGSRSSKVQQAKLDLNNVEVMQEKLINGLNIQINTARNNLIDAYLVFQNKTENLKLAKKINRINEEKFREGLASSMDLLQAHNQYLDAEREYINATLDLLDKKLVLEKLLAEMQ